MTTDPTLDQAILNELEEIAGPQLSAVLSEYLMNGQRQLKRLRAARAAGAWLDAAAVTHDMKGSYGYVGAMQLVDLCASYQIIHHEKKIDESASRVLLDQIISEFQTVQQALDTKLRSLPSKQ